LSAFRRLVALLPVGLLVGCATADNSLIFGPIEKLPLAQNSSKPFVDDAEACWSSVSFCSPTGYCANIVESDGHRTQSLEIRFKGNVVSLPAGTLDQIEHPCLSDVHLVSSGSDRTERLEIPFSETDASGRHTNKVLILRLEEGRVVETSTRLERAPAY
jgi:hypothetical protein